MYGASAVVFRRQQIGTASERYIVPPRFRERAGQTDRVSFFFLFRLFFLCFVLVLMLNLVH